MADEIITSNSNGASGGEVAMGVAGGVAAAANAVMNAQGLMTSITGMLPHAMLFVPQVNGNLMAKAMKEIGSSLNDDIMSLRMLTKTNKMKDKSVPGAGAAQVLTKQSTATTTFMGIAAELGTKGYVAMEVQYNPNSINFYSNASGRMRNYGNTGDQGFASSSSFSIGVMVNMRVQLMFDSINIQDAFRMEGMAPTISNGIDMAKNIGTNVAGGGYSVQKPVEGLLSLVNFRKTRQIIFYWSNMFFHGELTDVVANYTMFNKLGHPIRATVDLTMQQSAADKESFGTDEKAWEAAFDACFGEAGMANLVQG